MREARTDGYNLIESERSAAVAKRESNIEAVKSEVDQKVAQETAEIAKQTDEARNTLSSEAQNIADKISSSILRA